jgi:predicted membrane-bound spermidine synthase
MAPWFLFFLLSGFCGLVYETIWLRLAMARFGVTSPSLSILVSVFMAGLALGSWGVARFRERLSKLDAGAATRAYAMAELSIAVLGLPVPWLLRGGGELLASALAGKGAALWYVGALGWQALILLPACAAMGATIPLAMLAIGNARSFSFLYLANVLGAVLGALLPAFVLIELLGFRRTLLIATALNVTIALLAYLHSKRQTGAVASPQEAVAREPQGGRGTLALLFFTGFCSMGIEVVWTRQFTPFLGTVVYSFAFILAVYLAATFAGSALYRRLGARAPSALDPGIWAAVAAAGALALLATDVRHFPLYSIFSASTAELLRNALRAVVGVAPLSFALGFLTPQLVDRYSGGGSARAGLAYAVNTIGCILGPLLAGFVLLPALSESRALLVLLVPFAIAALALLRGASWPRRAWLAPAAAAVAFLALWPRSLDESFPRAQIRRDHTATTIALGKGMDRQLLVNGVGMTVLTPITKMMAHLPLALLGHEPRSALAICFGMGTSFRSFLTWNIPTTAVELVPGVPELFGYFHEDAREVLASPNARVVIDDGRRFLESDTGQYEVIIIDPPPPVSAASSSLLYSMEFYALAKKRLAPGGLLQQWVPEADPAELAAFTRALVDSFAQVVAFRGFGMGIHFIASDTPFRVPSGKELASRLPPGAAADLIEWGPHQTAEEQFNATLATRFAPLRETLDQHFPGVRPLEDDQPVNEYYLLRSLRPQAAASP